MFLGTYTHNIDDKNRLTLPSKIATELSKTVVVSRGFDSCLELRTLEEFKKYSEVLNSYSSNKKETRMFVRAILPNASKITIDNAKRILIPANLLQQANIKNEVTIIGVGNKIEIWDSDTYAAYKEKADQLYEEIAERLDNDK